MTLIALRLHALNFKRLRESDAREYGRTLTLGLGWEAASARYGGKWRRKSRLRFGNETILRAHEVDMKSILL